MLEAAERRGQGAQHTEGHAALDPLRPRVRFSGKLRGGYVPKGGKLIELQAYERGRWRSITTLRTNAHGAFSSATGSRSGRAARRSRSACGCAPTTRTRSRSGRLRAFAFACAEVSAELAIVNARVRTLDPAQPFATAVAVRGGTIVAVGDDAEVREALRRAHRGPGRARQRARPGPGGLAPAPVLGRRARPRDDLSGLPDARRTCWRRWPRATPQRGWLFAWGLDYDAAPTPAEIGEAVRGAAAFVRLSDLHTALASPRALQLAHVTGPHAFAGRARRSCASTASRRASCASPRAQDLVLRAAPGLRWPELRARHVEQLQRLNALGLTGAHVMDGEPATHDLLRDLEGSERADDAPARAAVADAGHDRRRAGDAAGAARRARAAVVRRRRRSSSPTA